MVAFTLGLILPQNCPKNPIYPLEPPCVALKETNLWLVLSTAVPLIGYGIYLIGLFTIMKYETIQQQVISEDPNADAHIKMMYKNTKTPQQVKEIKMMIYEKCDKNSNKVNIKRALTDPEYKKATWTNFVYMIFHELAGNNVIQMYSHQMFLEMSQGGGFVTPTTGTILLGVAHLIGSSSGIYVVPRVGRVLLLVLGHLGIAGCHAAVGVFNIYDKNTGVVTFMCLFLAIYQLTSGTVAWVYAAETTKDAGLACALCTLWSTVFVLSLVCPPLMNPSLLGPSNVFFMFSGLSLIAVIFVACYMKET